MLPLWVGVVSALSLAVIAVAALVVAGASVASALGVRKFLGVLEQLGGPAITDVRQLIGTIRSEADAWIGGSRELRGRILAAADAADARLANLGALVDVLQEEVEDTALDAAAALRKARGGLSLWEWGRKALKRGRRKKH